MIVSFQLEHFIIKTDIIGYFLIPNCTAFKICKQKKKKKKKKPQKTLHK